MSETANTPSTIEINPASANPSVARCCTAAKAAYDQVIARHESKSDADSAARKAYQKALPPLDSPANIRDFIACIAYGMVSDMFYEFESTSLLRAAQVAKSVHVSKVYASEAKSLNNKE